jgi:dienelactone hydrolase
MIHQAEPEHMRSNIAILSSIVLALVSLLAIGQPAHALIVTRSVSYQDGATQLEGLLAYDSSGPAKRPGVLLAHEKGASSSQARLKTNQIASLGYVVLSIDLYGKDITPRDTADAAARLALTGNNRSVVRKRAAAGLAAFGTISQADPSRLSAVGFGTGATAVLELARSKADLQGAVCVHGDLTPVGIDGKNIGASILAIVGADDPLVPLPQVAAFEQEMRSGGVDWQMLRLGGVAGDFTNPQAGNDLKSGRAFDPDADQRASSAIKHFLSECFAPPAKAIAAKPPVTAPKSPPPAATRGVPDKALKVLEYVDKNSQPMQGYEGGRTFGNFERRLPQTDRTGKRIRYQEWDVNPLRPGVNRGAERLVTGSDGTAHYTDDHYDSFKKIR